MNSPISITLNTAPYVTIERYAELSGLPAETIRKHIKNGLIPVKKKPVSNSNKASRTRTLINMIDITAGAASESKTRINLILGS